VKETIVKLLAKQTALTEETVSKLLVVPPSKELGDFAFPCFSLSKQLNKNPAEIALELSEKMKSKEFEKVESKGPYVNFFLDRDAIAKETIKKILDQKDRFGSQKNSKEKIIIEFSSPNIAKPLGVGHFRSTLIGNAIANTASFLGFKTIRMNHLGDWGTPFGKIVAGFKDFGSESKLKKDPIKHLYDIYVKTSKDNNYEEKGKEEFSKMEKGDKSALTYWTKFRKISLQEFNRMYKILGIKFDIISGESIYNKKMEKTIKDLEKKKLLEKSEGAFIVDLEKHNLGVVLIKKSDGSTLYATRDITAAIDRYQKHKFSKMIYEVGSEQKLYFKQLFKTLELLGHKWSKDCIHVEHGLYLDKDGRKFSTRKGKTIFMTDILEETIACAKRELEKREKLSKRELEERALAIAKAAIFYGDLKNFRAQNAIFDVQRFLSFEGNTGPYLLYTYARAKSILRKAKVIKKSKVTSIEDSEKALLLQLASFPEIVQKAHTQLAPNIIANYVYQVAHSFNEFYHAHKVVGSDNEAFRLDLVESISQVIKNALHLLGIETLEKM